MFIPATGVEATRRLAESALPHAPVEPDRRPAFLLRLFRRRPAIPAAPVRARPAPCRCTAPVRA
ncbi:MAG TPA: hypothetical protein VFV67_07325 [Actinophytocola sp.]|uniref:hypothetical protein n=1 Tax=Actinophytocola sp. TaxID=1872138 RepID=UPI002DBDCE13|nr:hypothetical protein [Actinophytocola sp.]HEU5470447.1 hypothetical protein [Actinophytocola sp.]